MWFIIITEVTKDAGIKPESKPNPGFSPTKTGP